MTTGLWAAWGVMGAFAYAAPRLLIRWGEARVSGNSLWAAFGELAVAMIIGPIFAAGFGPYCASVSGAGQPEQQRALGLMIGMVANPIAPSVVKAASGAFLRRIGGDRDK